jgi:hypothetical protein
MMAKPPRRLGRARIILPPKKKNLKASKILLYEPELGPGEKEIIMSYYDFISQIWKNEEISPAWSKAIEEASKSVIYSVYIEFYNIYNNKEPSETDFDNVKKKKFW